MRAAVLREFGSAPEVDEFEEPTAGDGEAVVEVSGGGMNPVEIVIASGTFYSLRPELPAVVGREGVGRLADGTRVFFPACVAPFGSFAERALISTDKALPLPDAVDDGTAIALWTAGLAAWMPLDHVTRMKEGDSVLILGSSGVVGQLAIQMARHRGAGTVVAAARSESGRERAAQLGADTVIGLGDPGDDDQAQQLRDELAAASGAGFDVVIDLLSGSFTQFGLDTLVPYGHQVVIGSPAGEHTPVQSAALRSRIASLTGYSSVVVDRPLLVDAYHLLLGLAEAGDLVVESEAIPLAEIERVWTEQENGPGHKLVVVPD
jgi:NADPH:quinone reductase-like Zn-dependent oxidoreductase